MRGKTETSTSVARPDTAGDLLDPSSMELGTGGAKGFARDPADTAGALETRQRELPSTGTHEPTTLGALFDMVDPPRISLWRIKDMRRAARGVYRGNLRACAGVSLIAGVLIWPWLSPNSVIRSSFDFLSSAFASMNWREGEALLAAIQNFVGSALRWTSVGEDASAGVITSVYNTVRMSGSVEGALISSIDHAIFRGSLGATLIAVLTLLATLAVILFVREPIGISSLRFFIEARVYPNTHLSRLLFIYRERKTLAIASAFVFKTLLLIAWSLTIVMLPVKYYSYLLYDYILAENPGANPLRAMRLSRKLMRGRRWKAFLLDLSFVPYYLLGLVTFGVAAYVYAYPYHNLARAEFYVRLRKEALVNGAPGVDLFNDPWLTERPEPTSEHLLYPDQETERAQRFHWDRDYSLINLILMFFVLSFVGWVYESVLEIAYTGHIVNRGTLYGPWLPIYGTGGVGVLLLLKKLRPRPLYLFLASMVVCGVIEYVTATVIFEATGLQYWSYQGYFFNIQGRVCLEGLLVFGLGCVGVVYLLAPIIDDLLTRIPKRARHAILAIIVACFLADIVYSLVNPRIGLGITKD